MADKLEKQREDGEREKIKVDKHSLDGYMKRMEGDMPVPVLRRVKKHRESLRAAGLRPVQIWVPDTRRKGFADECRRQSLLVADDPQEKEVLAWIEEVSDFDGWK